MFLLRILLLFALGTAAMAQDYEIEDVVVGGSKIDLKQRPTQAIRADEKVSNTRPMLDNALTGQSNIQIVPTPQRGSNVSLNGLNGEHVALFWDGDPILGRIDGALDTKGVALGSIDTIAVYQGLDSLPYGSQNVAGVISLETPWEFYRQAQLRAAGGNFGQTLMTGKVTGATAGRTQYAASASNVRSEAIRANPSDIDTVSNATAKIAASLHVSQLEVARLASEPVDIRIGGNGAHENSKGVLRAEIAEGNQRRIHVFTDARRKDSKFHFAYSEYSKESNGLGSNGVQIKQDLFSERAFRLGPELQEKIGSVTVLAGAQGDVHSTKTTRIPNGQINRTTVGIYGGARYALTHKSAIGAGTRWDSGPKLVSPRAELRHGFSAGSFDHASVLESGFGFREVTPKEQYLDFSNSAVRYRVVGNPNLKTERSLMTTLRHTAQSKKWTFSGSVFHVQLKNAIGYEQISGKTSSPFTYANISRAQTLGAQTSTAYRFAHRYELGASYQFLNGENLENQSALFLQPKHRAVFHLARTEERGVSFLGQGVWTGQQGFFDVNGNRVVDREDFAPAYWMAIIEGSYGFRWQGVSEMLKIFARVDNALNVVHAETLPVEPRTFLVGASVDL